MNPLTCKTHSPFSRPADAGRVTFRAFGGFLAWLCMLLLLMLPCHAGDPYTRVDLSNFQPKGIVKVRWAEADTATFLDRMRNLDARQLDWLVCEMMDDEARKEIMAYLIDAAWDAYEQTSTNMSSYFRADKETITRNVEVLFYKSGELVSTNYWWDTTVPMSSTCHMGKTYLCISCDSLGKVFTPEVRIAKIAHEVLGHGILRRFYALFLMKSGKYQGPESEITKETYNDDMRAIEDGYALAIESGTHYILTKSSGKYPALTQPLDTGALTVPNLYFDSYYKGHPKSENYRKGLDIVSKPWYTWSRTCSVRDDGGIHWSMVERELESYRNAAAKGNGDPNKPRRHVCMSCMAGDTGVGTCSKPDCANYGNAPQQYTPQPGDCTVPETK